MLRAAINGYGRIGRCLLRAVYETGFRDRIRIVAINEPADLPGMAHLTRFDSIHGAFHPPVQVQQPDRLLVADDVIRVSHADTPEGVDWAGMDIDLLFECSGVHTRRSRLEAFAAAGVPRVLVSNPMAGAAEVDATVVHGYNQQVLRPGHRFVSNASCTTNCAVPILAILDRHFGVESAVVTAIHSAMNDQPVLDGYHSRDLRRTRSAMHSVTPVETGLARGIERLLPGLAGRIQAHHLRIPTVNVSTMTFCLRLKTVTGNQAEAVNRLFREHAATDLAGILGYTDEPQASCDFNHDPRSVIVDGGCTDATGGLLHVLAWFDNEWGFANRMLDVALAWPMGDLEHA